MATVGRSVYAVAVSPGWETQMASEMQLLRVKVADVEEILAEVLPCDMCVSKAVVRLHPPEFARDNRLKPVVCCLTCASLFLTKLVVGIEDIEGVPVVGMQLGTEPEGGDPSRPGAARKGRNPLADWSI